MMRVIWGFPEIRGTFVGVPVYGVDGAIMILGSSIFFRGMSNSQVAFAMAQKQMPEQTQAPTTSLAKVSCPFMDISRAVVWLLQKDKAAKQFLDSAAVMHVNKMWGLMLYMAWRWWHVLGGRFSSHWLIAIIVSPQPRQALRVFHGI